MTVDELRNFLADYPGDCAVEIEMVHFNKNYDVESVMIGACNKYAFTATVTPDGYRIKLTGFHIGVKEQSGVLI